MSPQLALGTMLLAATMAVKADAIDPRFVASVEELGPMRGAPRFIC